MLFKFVPTIANAIGDLSIGIKKQTLCRVRLVIGAAESDCQKSVIRRTMKNVYPYQSIGADVQL